MIEMKGNDNSIWLIRKNNFRTIMPHIEISPINSDAYILLAAVLKET